MTSWSNEFNERKKEDIMRKVLGFALAMLFTGTMVAAAEETSTGRSSAFDDGTKFTVSEKQLSNLTPGEPAKAMFEGGKHVVVSPEPRAIGSEFGGARSWTSTYGTQIDSIQAE